MRGHAIPSRPWGINSRHAHAYCALWNTKKNTITLKQPNAWMNDWNSVAAGTRPRRTLRKVKTNAHNWRTVIRVVPTSASNAAFLRVMGEVWGVPVG